MYVPNGYNLLWLRISNDELIFFIITPYEATNFHQGEYYSGGKRHLLGIAPDGGA